MERNVAHAVENAVAKQLASIQPVLDHLVKVEERIAKMEPALGVLANHLAAKAGAKELSAVENKIASSIAALQESLGKGQESVRPATTDSIAKAIKGVSTARGGQRALNTLAAAMIDITERLDAMPKRVESEKSDESDDSVMLEEIRNYMNAEKKVIPSWETRAGHRTARCSSLTQARRDPPIFTSSMLMEVRTGD